MITIRKFHLMAAPLAAATLCLLPLHAHAKRKSPLAGKPVVVNKLELRKLRFNVTPFVAMSLSQPFVHMGYVGGKLGFGITDWLEIRGLFGYGVLNFDAKVLKAVRSDMGGLPVGDEPGMGENVEGLMQSAPRRNTDDFNNPAPLRHDFEAGLTRNQWLSSFDLVFTPFSGKMGLFSAIFTEYDMYVFAGLGLSGWNKHYPNARSTSEQLGLDGDPTNSMRTCRVPGDLMSTPNRECILHPVKADTGVKLGPSFGLGVHIFLADWSSINLEVQDIMSFNNITGLNATTTDATPVVNKDDTNANHNVTFQLGFKFYFPPKAKRSSINPSSKNENARSSRRSKK